MYDVDLTRRPQRVVDALHAQGPAGGLLPERGLVRAGAPGRGGVPGRRRSASRWTASPTSAGSTCAALDVLGPLLEARMDLCRDKGFDAVEADNVDGYANRTGFPLTAADQLRFNRFLAAAAHARGLSIGLKNDLDQVADARARLRLGAQRAVLPVRRVRAPAAVRRRGQGGVRGRVRARARGVLRAGPRRRAHGDAQAPRARGISADVLVSVAARPACSVVRGSQPSSSAARPGVQAGAADLARAARARTAAAGRAPARGRARSSRAPSPTLQKPPSAVLARGDQRLDDVADVDEVARLLPVAVHGRPRGRRPPRRRTARSRPPRRAGPAAARRRSPAAATNADNPCRSA